MHVHRSIFKMKRDISKGYVDEVKETMTARDRLPLDEPKVLREKDLGKLVGRVS